MPNEDTTNAPTGASEAATRNDPATVYALVFAAEYARCIRLGLRASTAVMEARYAARAAMLGFIEAQP